MGGRKISIPPTVLFSTIGRMPDVAKAVTLDVKRQGDLVYVIGITRAELGGSEFLAYAANATGNAVPKVDAVLAKTIYERVVATTQAELCHSLHTPALGGLGCAFAKKAIGGHLGLDLDLSAVPTAGELTPVEVLFSESNSRFVATVGPRDRERFEQLLGEVPHALVGRVTLAPDVVMHWGDRRLCRLSVDDLTAAYTRTLGQV
jgi:phosphoribosylformylglycinamidine synthase